MRRRRADRRAECRQIDAGERHRRPEGRHRQPQGADDARTADGRGAGWHAVQPDGHGKLEVIKADIQPQLEAA